MNASAPMQGHGAGRDFWLPTLQLATQEVFDLMLGSALEIPAEVPKGDGLAVTAMVGLAGKVCGVLSVRCSSKSAARMASRMLGIEGAEGSPETWDAVGEVCNMIAGNFKNKISGLGDGCMLSVPTVIGGQDYTLHSLAKNGLNTVLLFEQEPLVILLELHD
jgi:chemotaxis protein CheX